MSFLQSFKWLYPGLKVKRFIFLAALGLFFLVSGVTIALGLTLLTSAEQTLLWLAYYILRLGISPVTTGVFLAGLGFLLLLLGIDRLVRSVLHVLWPRQKSPWEVFYRRRLLEGGPRIVAIGGGTGLGVLLRGLKNYTRNLTAIVTVADDGGSSGRLRAELGIPPPGDIRNCLVALADTEALMEELFSYRFKKGEGLAGHSLGNLLLAAMTDIAGDFDRAISELERVLAVGGRVVPSTLTPVVLGAEREDGTIVWGESRIPCPGQRIKRVFLHPPDCRPHEKALEAIAQAEAIIIGPGSLYTSVLPNLLVPGIAEALRKAKAPVFYISNVMTQPGETEGYTVADHVRAIEEHCGPGLIDCVIAHSGPVSWAARKRYGEKGAQPVKVDAAAVARMGMEVRKAWLVDETLVVRHHPDRLAQVIMEELYKRRVWKLRNRLKFFFRKGASGNRWPPSFRA